MTMKCITDVFQVRFDIPEQCPKCNKFKQIFLEQFSLSVTTETVSNSEESGVQPVSSREKRVVTQYVFSCDALCGNEICAMPVGNLGKDFGIFTVINANEFDTVHGCRYSLNVGAYAFSAFCSHVSGVRVLIADRRCVGMHEEFPDGSH